MLAVGVGLDRMLWKRDPNQHGMYSQSADGGARGSSLSPPASVKIALRVQGIRVVIKPPGVKVTTRARPRRSIGDTLELGDLLPWADSTPIASLAAFRYGFLHRLDRPSSGLILIAQSFAAYCKLQWQLHIYSIQREYFVLGHGPGNATQKHLDSPIEDRAPHDSILSPLGQPSQSRLSMHSQLWCAAGLHSAVHSVVASQIVTGRRHQLRIHCRLAGWPTLADGRYGDVEVDVPLSSLAKA